ncbi:MAG: DinB family protein, partial [Aggregatilineales bacterium]
VWCEVAQDRTVVPNVKLCGWGEAPSSPSLATMITAWEAIIPVADVYLNTLTDADMGRFVIHRGRQYGENIGTLLLRHIYHYWYHLGEVQAIRQLLGHTVDSYVGRMPPEAHYFTAY